MGGKIDLYYDCNSPYSFLALIHLLRNKDILKSNGVEIELFPVFLGGIMNKSGNTPPWQNEAKQVHGSYDLQRAQKYFGTNLKRPPFFPIMSLLPQRSMTYVKDAFSSEKFEAASQELWKTLWEEHLDISKPEEMSKCLSRNFSSQEVETILREANSKKYKDELLEITDRALKSGAYGCPWFEVTNSDGVKEPFFGSDRFHFMWDFLGVPWRNIEILEPSKL